MGEAGGGEIYRVAMQPQMSTDKTLITEITSKQFRKIVRIHKLSSVEICVDLWFHSKEEG